ncbi:MAG: hypothetical protein QOJ98_2937 [Acidobacteriota bacterium]|nr:hypothetical protein [Acidobacteriota bacterium]
MCDGKHGGQVTFAQEYDLVREVRDRQLPNVGIVDAENRAAGMRKALEQLQSFVDLVDESGRQRGIALAVPPGRIAQITLRGRPQPDRFHRDSTSLRISASAARQSS